MRAGKIIAYIVAGVLVFFGILFIWGSGGSGGGGFTWVLIGIVQFLIAFALIFWASRQKAVAPGSENVTYKIDLPANVSLDTFKCKSCGGTLGPENIQMVAGAPVVTCPYCKTTYQLTEDPKW